MGRSDKAISKGITSEYLVKSYFSSEGYIVLSPDTHETHYDFVIEKDSVFKRVQCKTCAIVKYGYVKQDGTGGSNLVRVRNKRGCKGTTYNEGDYDILVGVWLENKTLFIFDGKDVLGIKKGESITCAREDGTELAPNTKAPLPKLVVKL